MVKRREKFLFTFIYKNHRDSEFLDRIVKKIQLIRHDLGSVSRLISRSFDKHISGEEVDLEHLS